MALRQTDDRQTDRQTARHASKMALRQTDDRQTDRQTTRHASRMAPRQTDDRQTDRQTDHASRQQDGAQRLGCLAFLASFLSTPARPQSSAAFSRSCRDASPHAEHYRFGSLGQTLTEHRDRTLSSCRTSRSDVDRVSGRDSAVARSVSAVTLRAAAEVLASLG